MTAQPAGAGEILVGTCNWADHEDFYPPELRGSRMKERLSWYARFFPIVEVDTSFYGIPTPKTAAGWVSRTPDGFLFNVKAYRSLTWHEREDGRPRPPTDDEVRDFLESLKPLRDAGRLAAVHYQFPPWFTDRPDARERLVEVRERHPDDIVAIEFRHRSWFDHGHVGATEDLLRELDCALVGVDAPQIGSGTAPPHLAITTPRLCIVRFHGRNRKTWYRKVERTAERFAWLYKPQELEEWVPAIREAARRGTPVHLMMNNNRGNDAVVNAFDMEALLDLHPYRPPEPVLAAMERRDGRVPEWVRDAPEAPPMVGSPGEEPGQLDLGV